MKNLHSEIMLTCSICCCTYYTKKLETLNECPAYLTELSTELGQKSYGSEIFLNPCKTHSYCIKCLRYLALNFDNHPIGHQHPFVRCQPAFSNEECTLYDTPAYFMHNDIGKILNEEEFQQYNNHADRFQFPGYEVVKCPRPLITNGNVSQCNSGILVPIDLIQTSIKGNLIIFCDQNERCYRKTCYHCHNLIGRRANACSHCLVVNEANDPHSFNHYFYKLNKVGRDGQSIMYRNNELTNEIIIEQLTEIIECTSPLIKCFECLIPMLKTEQCNTLSHCGIERCYCCGRSGTENQDLADHWESNGLTGCPRFDHSRYWNVVAKCGFVCEEGICYGHEVGECNRETHSKGIQNMSEERRKCQIYHALFSLLPEKRLEILIIMATTPKLSKYIPKYSSTDVRTCLPDSLYNYFQSDDNDMPIEERKSYLQNFSPIIIPIPPSLIKTTPSSRRESQSKTKTQSKRKKIQSPSAAATQKTRSMVSDLYSKYVAF